MEVLAPVKNLQAAKVVVQSGATEVYLGSPSFSARSNASNTIEEISEIVKYCQQYKVKTFIAFNVVVFEDEINKFLEEVIGVMNCGASGMIIQDPGLAKFLKDRINNIEFEIHASTQMNVHNTLGAKFLQNIGVCRLVVPREISFKNIRSIKDNTQIDIEAFIHGALCVSYSGQCYDSTLLDQKSANRGRCSQYCRMPQHILNTRTNKISNARYPLNLKDMNNHKLIDDYLEAGVDSLKIEGRLKSIEYAAIATESYANKKEVNYKLEQGFNREFTTGMKKGNLTQDMVNLNRPNNTGYFVGTVTKVSKNENTKLKFYSYVIEIQSSEKIALGDSIRYISQEDMGQTVEQLEITNTGYEVYSNLKPQIGDEIFKTKDINIYKHYLNYENKFLRRSKIEVDLMFKDNLCQVSGDVNLKIEIETHEAVKSEATKDSIVEVLSKTNNTAFDILTTVNIRPGIFIPTRELKKIKNKIIENYLLAIQISHNHEALTYEHHKRDYATTEEYYIQVNTVEQYNIVKQSKLGRIMINSIQLAEKLDNIDFENDILVLPRIVYDDMEIIESELITKFRHLCPCEVGSVNRFKDSHSLIGNFTLNVTNQIGLDFYKDYCDEVIASIELNYKKLKQFADSNAVVNVYGRVGVMLMDYCPINEQKEDKCGSCRRCRRNDYVLEDEYGRRFPLIYEENDQISMYSEHPINLLTKRNSFREINLKKFHLRFTNESDEEVLEVLNAINGDGKLSYKTTLGSYYKEVL